MLKIKGKCNRGPTLVLLLSLLGSFKHLQALPAPQNPMEMIGMGAMTVMGTVNDVLTNGGAVRRDTDIETPLFRIRGKTEAGVGDAMRPRSKDSDEDDRRRKRSLDFGESGLLGELDLLPIESSDKGQQLAKALKHVHRNKRSPCHMTGMGTPSNNNVNTGGTDTEDEDVRRRRNLRRRRASQRLRSRRQQRKSSKSRHRRQAEFEDAEAEAQSIGNKFAEHVKKVSQKIQGIFESMLKGMHTMVENLKKTFSPNSPPSQGEDGV